MSPIRKMKKSIAINYGDLNETNVKAVYRQFTDECVDRVNWVSTATFLGESTLVFLDKKSGFFASNPLNLLNLFAELLIIVVSLIVKLRCRKILIAKNSGAGTTIDQTYKKQTVFLYKIAVFIAVAIFIFTDIYVRQKTIGAYIVFLFAFQVIPFYKASYNIIIYSAYAIILSLTYLGVVPNAQGNTLFTTLAIFLAFGLSTESLRSYFIKKIIGNQMNEKMSRRFGRLASQSITALADTVEAKDLYTKGHSQRVATYSREIAKRIGYDEAQYNEVYYIGLLHDIGKIGVPDDVINKKGRLTDEEFAEIKKHPQKGYDILKNITEISDISVGAKWHHERYDGKGYPDGLKGDEIPLIAQIIAVADAYDAMTSTRSYREMMPQEEVKKEIERNIGKQFAPMIASIMLKMIQEDTEYKMHE